MFNKFREGFRKIIDKIRYKEIDLKTFEELKDELLLFLVENDVSYEVAEDIISRIRSKLFHVKYDRSLEAIDILKDSLKEYIIDLMSISVQRDYFADLSSRGSPPYSILFIGFNGVGKTTTIAKLAYLHKNRGDRVLLACSDTYRAGAIEQLIEHGERLGIPVFKYEYGADPAAVGYDALKYAETKKYDVVLIDTAGRMHVDVNLMEELRKINRVINPTIKILVLDALAGNDVYYQSKMFMEKVGFDGVIFTKIDADVKGGALITVSHLYRKPIYFLGVGQRYEDLVKFDINYLVNTLIGD